MISTKNALSYLMLALFVATLSGGIALLVVQGRDGGPGLEILLPTLTPSPELKVHISGAVARPELYTMAEGDRVADALTAAGGITGSTDLSCLNLAERVVDEARYHVPPEAEPCPTAPARPAIRDAEGRIDLNTATADDLESLPGIGPAKAQAIIEHRELNGPIKSIEDVLEVKGIGPATLEGMRDLIWVGE